MPVARPYSESGRGILFPGVLAAGSPASIPSDGSAPGITETVQIRRRTAPAASVVPLIDSRVAARHRPAAAAADDAAHEPLQRRLGHIAALDHLVARRRNRTTSLLEASMKMFSGSRARIALRRRIRSSSRRVPARCRPAARPRVPVVASRAAQLECPPGSVPARPVPVRVARPRPFTGDDLEECSRSLPLSDGPPARCPSVSDGLGPASAPGWVSSDALLLRSRP